VQIIKDSIIILAGEGRLTLQVPDTVIGSVPQLVNVPDDWFCFLKSDSSPCTGKQKGFLYLTEKGFQDNYDDLKKAFENAIIRGLDRTKGVGWPAFVQYAQDHFNRVRAKRAAIIARRQKEINNLQAFVV